jgi:hypothetical protein
VIWLYGICDRPELPASPESLVEGPLLAVFARESLGDPEPDALWAHERVVEDLMAERTVLPARFGNTLEDEDALRRLLRERQAELVEKLARVRGRVELGVRAVQLTPAAVAPASSGREYLLAKLAHGRLDAPLAELAVAARHQPAHAADEVLRGAYLVERPAVTGFRAALEDLQSARPDLALLCTGPWPPYSFV